VRVLLVEDHPKLATTVAAGLRREGMAVDVAFDGNDALLRIAGTGYDVVVLDRDLPDTHGDEVCRILIADGCQSRVLMLTAAGTVADRVEGLSLGADDYLAKPFAFAELVARIRALARRPTAVLPPVLVHGDLSLDTARRIAIRADRPLALNRKEFGVLERLLAAHGRVLTTEQLLEAVWDEMTDPFTKTVKVTMSRLRAKLGDPPIVETVSTGYRISSQ
jgi:DNA-binding response OmpR family regulator